MSARIIVFSALWLGLTPRAVFPQAASEKPAIVEDSLRGGDGASLFYRVVGRGADTIVVLHGGPGTGMREALDLEDLVPRGHTLILYDQRGTGRSELVSAPARLTLTSHVADLEAVRRHFRLARLKLIGLSWGSGIALHYAIAHPGSVERIAFLSPMPPTGRHFVQRFARLDSLRDGGTRQRLRTIDSLWATAPDSLLTTLCRESFALTGAAYEEGGPDARHARGDVCDYPPAVLRHRRTVRVAALRALGAEYDFTAALRRLPAPALVVEGARSKVPLDATRLWASEATNARLLLIPEAGHRTWLDRPSTLFPAIDKFFRGDWPAGATDLPSRE